MPIGDHICNLRWDRRLKQGELAYRAGIAQNTLSQIELGKTTPSVPTLEKIARGLNVDLSELLIEEPALAGTPGKDEAPAEESAQITTLFRAAQFGGDEVRRIVREMDRQKRRELIMACEFVLETARMVQRGSYRL